MDDLRWFASNDFTALVVPELRRSGLTVALDGTAPARITVAMSGRIAEDAWRYARALRTPLIVFIWDLPPQGTAVGTPDPVWSLGGRLIRLPRIVGGYRRRAGYYSRLRYIASRADAVWTPSGFTTALLEERFGVSGVAVPYCYDSNRFTPGPGPRDVPPVLLTVSRLEAHKNQAAVLEAAALLRGRVTVRLIGRGPEDARLRRLGEKLGVAFRLETAADDNAVEMANRTAAVAVCPSRFEGFGLGPIEALASGTPVVASDIPPHREFVGNAARLVAPDDPAAIARAVEEALESPAPNPSAVKDLTIPAAAARILSRLSPMLR
ncbi:MAG TPA: glycosyltransferase [Gemmatimonadales bacterium]